MINTKRLNIKQLVARIEQADPSIEIGKIEVQGDVNGHIVVGHGNVVGNHNIVYQSHSLFGAFINRDSSYVDIQKRPPSEPPHPPLRFVGRQRELSALEEHIGTRQPVLLYGQSGMGKTTLLQKAAHSEAAKSMPDGVIYLESLYEGNISSPEDILQRLFDRMFDSQPPVKLTHPRTLVKANLTGTHPFEQALERLFPKWFGPTTLFDPARIEGELARLKALILLDEPGIEQKALDRMARLLSASAVLVSDQTAPLDDVYESIRLKPLPREDAIQLFIKKSDIELDAKTRPVIEKICEILEDIPLAIATLANGVRQDRFQINTPDGPELQALIYLLEEFQPLSQDPVQAAIERSLKVLYRHLNWREQEMLSDVVSAPGRSVERELLENEGPGAEEAVEQVERLELLYANSPRMRLPQGLREVVRSIDAGLETPPRIQGFLEYLRTELRKHNPDSDFIAAELGNLLGILEWAFDTKQWEAVIELGQAVDPYLALHGLWDTWETVLKQVETAAQISKKPLARAWALHQLGTREIGIGTRRRAIELLRHALEIRIRKREFAAAVYTLHNLRFLLPAGPNGDEDGKDEPDTPRPKPGEVIRTYVETFFASLVGLALVTTLLLQPSMRFQIESTPTSYSPSGQLIEYSYTVDNAGIRQFAGPIFVTTEDQAEVTCPDLEDIGDQDSVLDWNELLHDQRGGRRKRVCDEHSHR
jgi:hypothetical protein